MNVNPRLLGAFVAGQVAMLGLLLLLRPAPADARADGDSITAQALFIRKEPNGAGMQLSAAGATGGPSIAFFDAAGNSRMQLSMDGQGKPTILLRGKTGTVAVGIGFQNEDTPVLAIRNQKGALTTVQVPDK